MLGGGDRIAARGVHDDDSVAGGGVHVHVIHTDAGASDDLEIRGGVKNGGGDFGLAADDERGEIGDEGDEFGFLEAGFDDDIEGSASGEFFDTALGDGVGYEDFG